MLGLVVEESQKDWDLRVPTVMAAYRASQHEATGYSPNALMFKRKLHAVLGDPSRNHYSAYDRFVEEI